MYAALGGSRSLHSTSSARRHAAAGESMSGLESWHSQQESERFFSNVMPVRLFALCLHGNAYSSRSVRMCVCDGGQAETVQCALRTATLSFTVICILYMSHLLVRCAIARARHIGNKSGGSHALNDLGFAGNLCESDSSHSIRAGAQSEIGKQSTHTDTHNVGSDIGLDAFALIRTRQQTAGSRQRRTTIASTPHSDRRFPSADGHSLTATATARTMSLLACTSTVRIG